MSRQTTQCTACGYRVQWDRRPAWAQQRLEEGSVQAVAGRLRTVLRSQPAADDHNGDRSDAGVSPVPAG